MTSASASNSGRAFVVRFTDLSTWSPSALQAVDWGWPRSTTVPLGDVIHRRQSPVSQAVELPLLTISFDGAARIRAGGSSAGLRSRLFVARAGDLVISKIDLRNGAAAIVPPAIPRAAVTPEFPVYEVDRTRVDPEYLWLVLRSRQIRNLLSAIKSGASGRKRIAVSQFERIRVPLPDLETQHSLLAEWRGHRDAADQARTTAAVFRKRAKAILVDALGVTVPEATHERVLVVKSSEMPRWSASYNQLNAAGMRLRSPTFPAVKVHQLLLETKYGTSVRATRDEIGVPILRMVNVVGGQLDFTDLKYVQIPTEEFEKLRLRPGDILVNRTNSKELVGKAAVFRDAGDYVFASYLIRLRVDPDAILPEYLVAVLNSEIGRFQISAVSRQIIGQANINVGELASLQVPLPPLDTQRALVDEEEALRDVAVEWTQTASELEQEAALAVDRFLTSAYVAR